jgi:GIY-YIG catalytic domain
MIYIYQLTDPRDGSIRYVGKTNNLRIRLKGHKNLRNNYTRCNAWKKELQALGLQPKMEVVEEVADEATWIEREQYWIDRRRAEGNILTNEAAAGASPRIGNTVSEYAKQLARERYTGRPIPPEQRAQISASLTGKKQSVETTAKRQATINANRIAKGLPVWNFGDKEAQLKRNRERYSKKARAAGRPVLGSPEWTAKRLATFKATVATLTPEERAARAAHLNVNPVRYWLGKNRPSPSAETREKRRQSMLATAARKRAERMEA